MEYFKIMQKLRIYVPGHNYKLKEVPDKDFLEKVFLPDLPIGKFQSNQLAENRIYLWDRIKEPTEYVGFLSPRYIEKHPDSTTFRFLDKLEYRKDRIYCLARTYVKYQEWFFIYFPGIESFMRDMSEFAGMSLYDEPGLLGNNFICSWEVFQEFHEKWLQTFHYLYDKYRFDKLTFKSPDDSRKAGYLYEALTAMIFANLIKKNNLELKTLVPDYKNKKLSKKVFFKSRV